MHSRAYFRTDGTVILFFPNWRRKPLGMPDKEFADAEAIKSGHSSLPYRDYEDGELPPLKGPNGKHNGCKLRGDQNRGVWVDSSIECVHEKQTRLRAKLAGPNKAEAVEALLELERMKGA